MRTALVLVVAVVSGCGRAPSPSPLRLGGDFTSQSLAVGVKQRFQLQLPAGLLYGNVDGTLTVHDSQGDEVPVTKTGTGQFETVLPTAGEYTIDSASGTEQSTIGVRAELISALRLVDRTVYTTAENGTGCSRAAPGGPVSLAPNQRLGLSVSSVNASGSTMSGIYDLEVLDLGTWVSRPFLFGGPNQFSITAAGNGSVTFTEKTSGKSAMQTILRLEAPAVCP